jgi:hypothetical protein
MTWLRGRTRGLVSLVAAAALGACDPAPPAASGTVGTWTLTAPLLEPRAGHSMTVLPDGRVLVAGGFQDMAVDEQSTALDGAELYDPTTGTWLPTARMGTPRFFHVAVLLFDGRVLVAGGCRGWTSAADPQGGSYWLCVPLDSAETYDPASGSWTSTGSMWSTRKGPGLLLPDGRVLVTGSETGSNVASFTVGSGCEVYDPASGTWAETGPMVRARSTAGLALLPSGSVLAVGGVTGLGIVTALSELYAPASGTWRPTGQVPYPIRDQTMTLLPTGEVLLASGREDNGTPTGHQPRSAAQLYDPASETWRPTSPMTWRRDRATAVRLASGHVLLSGGNFPDLWGDANWNPAPGGDVYDPWLDTWTPTPIMPHYVMYRSAAVLLTDGDVLQAGGLVSDGTGFGLSDLFGISAAQRFHWDGPPASP